MNQGDQYGVYLNSEIFKEIDKEEAFSKQHTTTKNTQVNDFNEIGIMNLSFSTYQFMKEFLVNSTLPFSVPIVQILDGEIGAQNRDISFLAMGSINNFLIYLTNVLFFTYFNENIQLSDLVFLNLLFIFQKIVIGIKQGQMNEHEYEKMNLKVFEPQVLIDNLLWTWRNPDNKYLHLCLIKAEFISGINMGKKAIIHFNKCKKEFSCLQSKEQVEIINKINNCDVKNGSNEQSLRFLAHLIIFKSSIPDLIIISFILSIIYSLGPIIFRLIVEGPFLTYSELILFIMIKYQSFSWFLVNMIFLDAARIDLERRELWMNNLTRTTGTNGHSDLGIQFPLNTTNNIVCQLSSMTQLKMTGLQYQNRLQLFSALQVILVSTKIIYLIIVLLIMILKNESLQYETIQVLLEITYESTVISLFLQYILKAVGMANQSAIYASTLIDRNSLYLSQEISRIKKFGDQIPLTNETTHENNNTLENRANSQTLESNIQVENKKINNDQVNIEDLGINIVENTEFKQKVDIDELEAALEMSDRVSQLIKDEGEKYPFSILGMTEETTFLNLLISVLGTLITLALSQYFNIG